jgi:hypothetical protein
MVVVPLATPVTTPVVKLMVAAAVLVLVHVPPVVLLLSAIVLPWQTIAAPVTGVSRFTITVLVVVQPPGVV